MQSLQLVLQECVELRRSIGSRLEVVWYPSHAEKKLKCGTAEEKANVAAMRNKLGLQLRHTVEDCNEIADKLAAKRRDWTAEEAVKVWSPLDPITL